MTSFGIDRQTIDDLGIFTEAENNASVFSFYNHVRTIGGKKKLTELMHSPSADIKVLTSRRDCIKFFHENPIIFNIDHKDLDFIEHYLGFGAKVLSSNYADAALKSLKYRLNPDNDYYVISQGISNLCTLIRSLWRIYNELSSKRCPVYINKFLNILEDFLLKKDIENIVFANSDSYYFSYFQIAKYDEFFRRDQLLPLKNLLNIAYELDAYISVSQAVSIYNFSFPEYQANGDAYVDIRGLYHPVIKNAVANDFLISKDKNLFFLTGANMAGKSSFLKALGLTIYLAHIGFPVPAASMQTSVFNGLVTTINLADNIGSGYSHYYSEIKRVKETARKILEQDNLFVIFDELFRGTNVKDAHDASLAVIKALSAIKNSVFLISTHIVEIATQIADLPNISFQCFSSHIDNGKPVFEYKLKDGVSSDTLGFFIFKNEGILEILAKASSNINQQID